MKLGGFLLSLVLFSSVSMAGVLTVQTTGKVIEGVTVAQTATVKTAEGETKLDLLGAGLRNKKVLVTNVRVYVAQILADNAAKFVRTNDGALKSLKDMKTVAITLTFLRDVEAEKVMSAFLDSLDANGVDYNKEDVSAFLEAVRVGGQADNGKTLSIVLTRVDEKTSKVVYEATNGSFEEITGDAQLFDEIASIWLGKTTDGGLENAKTAIVKGM